MKLKRYLGLLTLITVLVLPVSAIAGGLPSFVDLAKKCGPAVVNINTVKMVEVGNPMQDFFKFHGNNRGGINPFEDFFRQFDNRGKGNQPKQKRKTGSLGSGFIISADGYIVTNNHVVASADEIKVKLQNDGHAYPAKLIGLDKETDLAVLKIDVGKELPFLTFANSEKAEVGEWVLAIGNPFGLGHTVTKGIISAKGRIIGAGPFDNFIQTDASINPGNSGGPLIDMNGHVVGINTAIIASGQGIGFAIPSNMAKNVIDQLKTDHKVSRGWLGVTIQDADEKTTQALGLTEKTGALVNSVNTGDPAHKGGMKVGDVILKVNGEKIDDTNDLLRTVAALPPGKKVAIDVWRQGKIKRLSITLGDRNGKTAVAQAEKMSPKSAEENVDKLGMVVRKIDRDAEADSLGLEKPEGLLVIEVTQGSPAEEAAIAVGDVILEANQHKVNSLAALKKILNTEGKKRGLIMLLLKRQGKNIFRTIELKDK
ncbi:DegQ family serine endoprotease [Maridesulfovibrio hydrothermalis]|uniref:Probable periplasmic serine endoprotease DegP-like n=1 Tax=Maridesulfovibrio hydrothermalis AM13 = DSM 14728 TaxID=1121451 RepID=L0RGP8_9BACT|nr:DegQ family serine endoprotease [Maridesulfovibrio hydrothermalis]CCO25397.1 serine protease do-like [Maridesulfovibrio hydrothermalis AM13 = DSM 14728]